MAERDNEEGGEMLFTLLRTLAEEQVFLIDPHSEKLPFSLNGIIRLVDSKGNTLAVVLDKKTLDELEEDLEAQTPEFLISLDRSRASGRVSAKEVKRKARLV